MDPSIEEKVAEAAIQIYAEVGWAGFTFDAVAARAGVGKAAIYRRWSTKMEILSSAWKAAQPGFVEVPDTGSIRGDLVALAKALLERLDQPVGIAEVRLLLDTKMFGADATFPDLDATRRRSRTFMRAGIERAIQRGDLPPDARPEMIFDAVRGMIIHNFLLMPSERMDVWRARKDAYAEEVVDLVLAGVRARSAVI
ncbi:TetR/AcrR family transcriptional regulator [Frankia sp. CNm7]|uniref:TetR/AcrR family transcriptional regulator n=1 Tax=Frankia nepalensis TaxID=1836974 RepID=A0A937RNV7_9ACTN|nr:TetR/AcrR family transcriptional regulator [Frankia nepalensis]MBL7515322.1 TetR/AcrR family transcriptional regulator [Frankia nepalensis]MBL7522309.1 TetR/AcrR family transcriptional regulator [Frankia nepalensis]MBL7632305.1 TetR/AcrR family transcriptional regulator [Frankia nepalensis]